MYNVSEIQIHSLRVQLPFPSTLKPSVAPVLGMDPRCPLRLSPYDPSHLGHPDLEPHEAA